MLSDGFSSSSSSTNKTRGFEGVTTSYAMTKFSPASTKTKKVAGKIWYLYSEGVDAIYLTN